MYVCVCMCMYVYVCVCICVCVYVYMYVLQCTSMYCNEISCNLMYLSVLNRFFPINQVSHQSSIRWVKSTRSPASASLLKTHLQHPVRFIQDHKGRASQVAALHLHDVNETSGGGNDDLTATCPDHILFMIECG